MVHVPEDGALSASMLDLILADDEVLLEYLERVKGAYRRRWGRGGRGGGGGGGRGEISTDEFAQG